MAKFLIEHTEKLAGKVTTQGAKNSALPILTATLLCDGVCTIDNCPKLSDVSATLDILEDLGARASMEKNSAVINTSSTDGYKISKVMTSKMRSSILFLGAVAARFGKVELCLPGGCKLGPRPINWHLEALSNMGMQVECQGDVLICAVDGGRFHGARLDLPLPSVGATENIILAAVLAHGTTVLNNAAREPEICDLCEFLTECGAKINGAGQSQIEIVGVDNLHGARHEVISDRIVAATFMVAAAAVGGNVLIEEVVPEHLQSVVEVLRESGCTVVVGESSLRVVSDGTTRAMGRITTEPYPGFPTDAQALFMMLASVSQGETTFVENIFANRYKHVTELLKMGAEIKISEKTAIVRGVRGLRGNDLFASDLRSAAALTVAGLVAAGETTVRGLEYLDRGYEDFERKLMNLGAKIRRI